MLNIVPVEYYTLIYYQITLFFVVIALFHSQSKQLGSEQNISFMKHSGFLLLVFLLFYIGLRPINGVFTDMKTYLRMFERYRDGYSNYGSEDPGFHYFILYSAKIMTPGIFFFICSLLYILPLYIVSKKWFANYWFYSFLVLVGSLSFWNYGVNGIRNGLATSLFLLGISREKRIYQGVWIFLSMGFHFSTVLPAIGFILANIYNYPKKFFIFWVLSIPLSLLAGGFFQTHFAGLVTDDPRLTNYLTTEAVSGRFSHVGFRWDFLLYSAAPVFAGWYYINKLYFKDKLYFILYSTYLFANAFWILVIRANFSNRFAYLSWFMMALVIVYPLLRKQIIPQQHKKIGYILFAYFSFTYLMGVIIK